MKILKGLLGPSLNSNAESSKINTDSSWLGLGLLYFAAQTSKYFLFHIAVSKYSQGALDICDIGEELLSAAELINATQELASNYKWAKEVRDNNNTSDFTIKVTQVAVKIIFNAADVFCNTVRVGFLLTRIHLISCSSELQKQLEKINECFYLLTQVFYLFQEGYQIYLNHILSDSCSLAAKKELEEKTRLSLLSMAEKSVKIFLGVFKKVSKGSEGSILALSSCVLVLKISSYLYDGKVTSLHKGKFSLSDNRFVYGL